MDLWWFYRLAKLLIQCSIVFEILNIVSSQTNSTINISCVTTTAFMKSRAKIPGILCGPLPEIVSSTLHGQGKFFRASNKNILTIISSSVYPIEGLKPLNCEEETIFQILYENLCEIGLWLKLDQDVKIGLRIQNFDFSFVKNLRSEQNRRYKHFRFKQTSNNCMAIRFLKLCGTEARSWMGHTRHQLCKRSQTTFSCLQVQTLKLFIFCSSFLVQTSKQQHQ